MANIGDKVTFIRLNGDDSIAEGEGTIIGIFLDPARHLTAHIKTEKGGVNAYVTMLKPTDKKREALKTMYSDIRDLELKAKEAQQPIVDAYNAKISARYAETLGEPVTV